MAILTISRFQFYAVLQFLMLIQSNVFCYTYKVGDLDAWAIPSEANKNVYARWSKNHSFKIGDSLFFLYPPSIDSVNQVSKQAYASCDLKDPILKMNDGNSLFNITTPGEFFFISGEKGHCEKSQKLYIALPGNGSYAASPSYDPSSLPDTAPSYTNAFGSIPAQPSSSSSIKIPVFMSALVGLFICALIRGSI